MKNRQQIEMVLVNVPLVYRQRSHRRYWRRPVHCKTFRNVRPIKNRITPRIVPKTTPTINPIYQLFARTREAIIGMPFMRSTYGNEYQIPTPQLKSAVCVAPSWLNVAEHEPVGLNFPPVCRTHWSSR